MLISFGISCFMESNTGQFCFINNDNELIVYAKIKICNQIFEFKDITPHEKCNGTFKVTSDSHYTIHIVLNSGKEIKDQLGYVTYGFDYKHTIVLADSKLSFTDIQIQ